jgi:ABC-type sugar transport system substrate-binding protein
VGLSAIPATYRTYYTGYQYFIKMYPNGYANWSPPKPPWKFCYNDSYIGNAWRADSLATYQRIFTQLKADGLATGTLDVTESNNNISLQLAQLESQIRSGCNVIISIPGSPTGLNAGIAEARQKGVLFIADEAAVDSGNAINVTFNDYYAQKTLTAWVMKAMGGKGNVVNVLGIPGETQTAASISADDAVFASNHNVKVLGTVYGQWTAATVKSVMLEFLATHPEVVNGIIDNGASGLSAEQALQQDGRPLAKTADYSAECGFLAFWKQTHIDTIAQSQGGGPALYEAVEVALRMMAGQKPVVNSIFYPLPIITAQNFDQYYKPTMTLQSSCFANPPNYKAVPDSFFNGLFTGGTPVTAKLNPAA